jgi:hypothetical protein
MPLTPQGRNPLVRRLGGWFILVYEYERQGLCVLVMDKIVHSRRRELISNVSKLVNIKARNWIYILHQFTTDFRNISFNY